MSCKIEKTKLYGKIVCPPNKSYTHRAIMLASLAEGKTVLSGDESLRKRPMQPLLDALESIGAKCSSTDGKPPITVSGTVKGGEVNIPGNISSQFVPALMIIGDEVTCEMMKGDLPQGDEKIIDILEDLGVVVTLDKNAITVKSPELLEGGKFDLIDTPDLLPPLAILVLKSSKPIELFNVKHARYKETDRIAILGRELQKLGVKVKEKEDGLILEAPDNPKGAELNSENDHRLFMAFS